MRRWLTMTVAGLGLAALTACQCMMCSEGAIPDLTGEWQVAHYSHHHAKHGHLVNANPEAVWRITSQEGRHFTGERTYTRHAIDGKILKESFSGVIAADNVRFYIVDHEEDIGFGEVLSADELSVCILGKTHSDREPRAGHVRLLRSGQ